MQIYTDPCRKSSSFALDVTRCTDVAFGVTSHAIARGALVVGHRCLR